MPPDMKKCHNTTKKDGEPIVILVHHLMEFGSKLYVTIPLPETGLQSGPLCYIEAVLDSIRHCREEVEFISDLVLNV